LKKFALCILLAVLFQALVIPFFSEANYDTIDLQNANLPPSFSHLFGTDDLGRDIFIRCSYGARISLTVGIAAALVDLVVGLIWGGIAGLYGGKVDEIMMRGADICYSLPYLLPVILLTVVLGPGLFTVVIALTITGWINMARVVRAQVMQLNRQEYVLAAAALGASQTRILCKHILPNALPSIISTLTLTIPAAIFAEAFLGFLGLGIQAPAASWGTMANEGLPALEYYPWRIFFPIGLITLTILAFNILGNCLADEVEIL